MKNWKPFDYSSIKNYNPKMLYEQAREFALNPIVVDFLLSKGIDQPDTIQRLIFPSIHKDLHDPLLLKDMKKACLRIKKALLYQEKILIFGDYDCDGMTSTALMYLALEQFDGVHVSYRCPLRSEGYGLSVKAIEECEENTSLIITVDNGTSSHEALAAAKKRGIDVIVTDHHEILGAYPDSYAFINPHRPDNDYPFPSLCGVGVVLKVIQTLYRGHRNRPINDKEFYRYLQICTLGTIADLMPMRDENHGICKLGLQLMRTSPIPLFKLIFEQLRLNHIDSSTISFSIAPLFNAIGRLDDPNRGVELLVRDQIFNEDVEWLINLNERRKMMTAEQFTIAEKQIHTKELHKDRVIVVYDDAFENGIIGILAGKIAQKYKKPTVVISGQGTGSARSIGGSGFSIINVIKMASDTLIKFGGHQAAAGFSIKPQEDHLEKFRKELNFFAMSEPFHEPVMTYTDSIPFSRFSRSLYCDIMCLEPFGVHFQKPLFYTCEKFFSDCSIFGKNEDHLKFHFDKKQAVAFFKGHLKKRIVSNKTKIHMLYTPSNPIYKSFLIHGLFLE